MKIDYILTLSAIGSILLLVLAGFLRKKVKRGSGFAMPLDFAISLFFLAALVTTLWLRDKSPILLAAAIGAAAIIVGGGFLAADFYRSFVLKKRRQTETVP